MTFTLAQAESLYAQVADLQSALVRRGELHPTHVHEVAYGNLLDDGTTHIECTCGHGFFRPDDESQAAYALHVADALGLRVLLERAA